MPEEFWPARAASEKHRLEALEDWASNFSGRFTIDPSQEEAAAAVSDPTLDTGSPPGALSGDVTGSSQNNTVERIQGASVADPAPGDDGEFARYASGTDSIAWEDVPLTGDASGDNTAVVVNKAKGVDFPTPVADDDRKALRYLHGSVDYVLQTRRWRTQSTAIDITLDGDDEFVAVDASGAARTTSLPAASAFPGIVYLVKKTDASANPVTVDAAGADTIDGVGNFVLLAQYDFVEVLSDGTAWHVIGLG